MINYFFLLILYFQIIQKVQNLVQIFWAQDSHKDKIRKISEAEIVLQQNKNLPIILESAYHMKQKKTNI